MSPPFGESLRSRDRPVRRVPRKVHEERARRKLSEWLLDITRVCAVDSVRVASHRLEHEREERVLLAIAGQQPAHLCLELRSIRNCRRQLRIVEVGNCRVGATGNKKCHSGRECTAPGSSHL